YAKVVLARASQMARTAPDPTLQAPNFHTRRKTLDREGLKVHCLQGKSFVESGLAAVTLRS
ncbi:hypothetical protein AVEN_117556-1, partial [Araneus ventricosus]